MPELCKRQEKEQEENFPISMGTARLVNARLRDGNYVIKLARARLVASVSIFLRGVYYIPKKKKKTTRESIFRAPNFSARRRQQRRGKEMCIYKKITLGKAHCL